MANSKSNSKSKTAPKQGGKKAPEPQYGISAETNRIIGIVVFALSLIAFFVGVIRGDGAWLAVHNVYVGLFGMFAAWVFPILTILITVLYSLKEQEPSKFIVKSIESVVMVLLISTFIFVVQNPTGLVFKDAIFDAYKNASDEFNGGFFGALIGWVLLTFGKAPAIIVNIILIFVDFMLMTGITIIQFLNGTAKPAKVTYEKVRPVVEERLEQRRMSRDAIDVPLDPIGPDEEPKKKTRKKKPDAELDVAVDGEETTSVPQSIIDEINAATARNRAQREKAKTIDEIVSDATDEKPEEKKPEETFTVSDEQMQATVEEYHLPPISILKQGKAAANNDISGELKANAEQLIDTLHSFKVDATITDISRGPTVTRYELKPAVGTRVSKITNLVDDIALNLAATNVRIEAPIPGKAAVGIEVPNSVKSGVSMRELIDTPEFGRQKSLLSAGIGKDIAGNCIYCDVAKMPHLLIAGTTGSGKSVCMNSIIVSILYRAKPDEVKFLMIDPKKVEFSKYEGIPHLLVPVVTDAKKASGALGWAVSEMLQRYNKFSETGVRDIGGYNKYVEKHKDMERMPQVCIFIDELADLMMAAPKEVEDSICRLAQMARAAGMHLVIATQRPSVDVITGLIKANISSRIALTVKSQIDSRTIIDSGGAEKLLGQGDMLYAPIGASKPVRVQGCYISDEEVEELCEYIKGESESTYDLNIQKEIEAKAVQDKKSSPFEDDEEGGPHYDELFDKAAEVVIESGTASTSFLQRKISVGYSRGAKIIDQLQEYGVIGPPEGSKPRQVLMNMQQFLEKRAYDNGDFTAENSVQMEIDDPVFGEDIIDNQDYDEDEVF